MQWIALRAHTPLEAFPTAATSAAGGLVVSSESPSPSPRAAWRIRKTRVFVDFSLWASLPVTARVRYGWVQNSWPGRIPSCCSPVCAVNPRSGEKCVPPHNLPDTFGKELSEKEDVIGIAARNTIQHGQFGESKKKKESTSWATTTERGRTRRLQCSEEKHRGVKEKWRNAGGPVERQEDAGGPTIETDGDLLNSGILWENKAAKTKRINSEATSRRPPQNLEAPSEGILGGRGDLWRKEGAGEPRHPRGGPAISLQTRTFGENLTEKGRSAGTTAIERAEILKSAEEVALSVREGRNDWDIVDGFKRRGPAFLYRNERGFESSSSSNTGDGKARNKDTISGGVQSNAAEITTHTVVQSLETPPEGGVLEGWSEIEDEKNPLAEGYLGPRSGRRELVDYNGEKVIEVWRKGRVVKRYKPLGIEFLYGRTKPTRLYGPLNSRGEVPGSSLAPVPRRYRDRCEHQEGWTIKEVVTKILELNHWEDIDFVLNHWVGRYNRKNFLPLMQVMTSTGALKHSARLFTWMKVQRCYRAQNDIYNLMIWLYVRHNRVDRARSLFKEMQEWRCKPDLETYNAIINVHGRARQWQESVLFFNRMLQAAVPPSTGTYNNLINACGSSGQWQKALELYRRMKDDGVEMDVVTHNTVLTALKVGGQYAMAIEHFERTLQWEVQPDCVTLNIIISCFSKMERYDEAVQLFNSMANIKWDGCNPNLVTFTTVMHVYAACGQVENVKAVFERMVGEGIVPNIVSYNTLIGAYASMGMDVEALEIFELLQKVGFEPDVVSYTALINAYSKSGKPDDAARVFVLMKKNSRKPNIVTYNTLIDAYSSAGRVTEALRLLPDMDFDGIPPTVVTICSLIVACGRSDEIERVSDVLRVAALRKIRLNVNVYNTILSVYVNGGLYEEANKVYTSMKEGVNPDAITFGILIKGAAKVGRTSQAQRHFDEMLALGVGMSVEACSALIHAYAEQGLPEDAHMVLTMMKESGCEPNIMTYTSLIHAYKTAGMPEAAVAVFEDMETLGVELDAVACSALFTVFNRCGQTQKTLLLWSKWRDRLQFGAAAYIELSKACSVLQDWQTAMELFEEMQRVGVKPNQTIGNNMLRCLSRSQKTQLLTKMFMQLQELGMMATEDTYTILIDAYSRTHNWRQCLEILDRFKADNLQPDLETYILVLKCLEKVQLWDKYLVVYNQMEMNGFSITTPAQSFHWRAVQYLAHSEVSKVMVNVLRETGQEERAQVLESHVQASRQENESTLREALSILLPKY